MPAHRSKLPIEIRSLIAEKRWKALAAPDLEWPDVRLVAPELVEIMLNLEKKDRVMFFRALPKEVATEVFSHLEGQTRDTLLLELTDRETRHLLAELSPDDRTTLLGELPGHLTQRLLNLLSADDLEEARHLLGYPEESVGRLMTPDYLAVRPEWTTTQALQHIRKRGRDSETVDVIYVVDSGWRLIDDIPLRRLVLADPQETVEDLRDYVFASLKATEDREEAVRRMQRYDRHVLPVVNSEGVLLGIVTADDVLDVAQDEATEDFHLMGAVVPLKTSYWEAGKWILYRSRIVWLAALVVVNLISSGVIAAYEETLAAFVALAFFIPLIIDTGGNAGAQSATLMIRSISVGDVKLDQWGRVFLKELVIGVAMGVTLGLMGLLLGIFRDSLLLGLVVLLTMVTMLILTNLIGMLLPFILTRLRLDPAIASGPLITSVADAVGLLIYFSFATWLLGVGS